MTEAHKPLRVLFICTANSARSQMAEGLLRALVGGRVTVFSAGTEPGPRVHPLAVEVMREMGIDLAAARPKALADLPFRDFDWVITVCDQAAQNCPVWLGHGHQEHWSIPDPAAVEGARDERLAAFRAARDDLAARLRDWLRRQGLADDS